MLVIAGNSLACSRDIEYSSDCSEHSHLAA